ncbi:hypothetical protein [Streptomyces sp. NPDC093149]
MAQGTILVSLAQEKGAGQSGEMAAAGHPAAGGVCVADLGRRAPLRSAS